MIALSHRAASAQPEPALAQEYEPAVWAPVAGPLNTIVKLLTDLVRLAEENAVRVKTYNRYTTEEVAKLFGKMPRTPQKWCRDRQVNCVRIVRDGTYRITSEEVERIRNKGLLPPGAGEVTEE